MAFAWGSSENAQALFRGAFAAAVLVPIVAYVFWMAYRIWGNKKPREDENRMIENIIFDVGNVLMGYDSDHKITGVVFDNVVQEGVKFTKDNVKSFFTTWSNAECTVR